MKGFLLAVAVLASSVSAGVTSEARATAREVSARAIEYLRSRQGPHGGWSVNPDGPTLPAVSALALTGMLADPRVDWRDPDVARGIEHVLSFRKADGGIHDGLLPTYNTAICVSLLSRVPGADAGAAVVSGVGRLRSLQWGAVDLEEQPNPEAPRFNEPIDESHPYYGGVGYGNNGRPDMSNLQFFMQALHDAGVSSEDPAVRRALVFLRRVQMDGRVNPRDYAEGSRQGGFIYATVPNAESVDEFAGQSQAGTIVETLDDGRRVSRLRAYGSITYAGFKSLIHADLAPDDERVRSALEWIRGNWTLAENPGLGDDGYYYYLLSMGRALDAWGENELETDGGPVAWREALIAALADLQQPDGSFRVRSDRWLENNPDLITAYALIALWAAAG